MKNIKSCILIFMILAITTGVIYPLAITALGQVFFQWRSNGSLIYKNNALIGSDLIGQSFNGSNLFWSRPSSTPDFPYNSMVSGGSNLGPTNPELISRIKERIKFLKENGLQSPIPSSLVMGSGSSLDPDITPEAAISQVPRISKTTKIPADILIELIKKNTKTRILGFIGAERVNVLKLNLALIDLEKQYAR